MKPFNKYFDHTLLKADASQRDILKLCRDAQEYNFASVCVNGCFVAFAANILKETDVKIASVVGFPLGAMTTNAKYNEATEAIENGANEIDYVINISYLKDSRYDLLEKEIHSIAKLCHANNVILKVILETCLLTSDEIKTACLIAKRAEADCVKTSTGFSTKGAEVETVKLMKESISSNMFVKASGGIRTLEDAKKMIEAGAERLGCSASVEIIKEYEKESK